MNVLKLRISDQLKQIGAELIERHGTCHAAEPARVRGRLTRRQACQSAHHCRGLPGPHRHQRIHTSFPRPPFEHALPGTCAGYPALSCASVVSRTRFIEAPRYGGNWIHVGDVNPIGLADRCALSGVCISAAWRPARWGLSDEQTPWCRPPSMRTRTRICARPPPVPRHI